MKIVRYLDYVMEGEMLTGLSMSDHHECQGKASISVGLNDDNDENVADREKLLHAEALNIGERFSR